MRKTTYRFELLQSVAALFSRNILRSASKPEDHFESSVRQSFVFRSFLKGDDILMVHENGVVTLTGTVSDESHISLARETIACLPGVAEVKSTLKEKDDIPGANTDAWLMAKVRSTLWFHQNLSTSEIEVIAKEGVITLRGKAASLAQKNLATEFARDVEGVTKVKNEMVVSSVPRQVDEKPVIRKRDAVELIDDASITGLVKTTLRYHRSSCDLGITVETKDGVVKLEGQARSWDEKKLITRLVLDVYGVRMVFNNMVVEKIQPKTN